MQALHIRGEIVLVTISVTRMLLMPFCLRQTLMYYLTSLTWFQIRGWTEYKFQYCIALVTFQALLERLMCLRYVTIYS